VRWSPHSTLVRDVICDVDDDDATDAGEDEVDALAAGDPR